MMQSFLPVLERVAEEIEGLAGRGRPADYIPALAAADPRLSLIHI